MPKRLSFGCQEEESKQSLMNDPTRGTPDGGELSEEGDITETQTPTSKNDRQPKPLELEEAIRKAKKNVSSSLERNQETKFRTRNLQ